MFAGLVAVQAIEVLEFVIAVVAFDLEAVMAAVEVSMVVSNVAVSRISVDHVVGYFGLEALPGLELVLDEI